MIVDPPSVSLKTWWRLANQDTTLLRALENDRIVDISLTGSTLDVGGGLGFGYVDRIRHSGPLHSINIAKETHPTFLADLNERFPIDDSAYDNVICFNTIEHIFNQDLILSEILRVLRPGGRFVITMPFLFKRHGNYGDFHRHTADYWEKRLTEAGLSSQAFVVQPLVWCPLTTGLASLSWFRGGLKGRAAKLILLSIEWARSAVFIRQRSARQYADWALGFYIEGTKTHGSLEPVQWR